MKQIKSIFKENLIILIGLGITVDTFKLNTVIKYNKLNFMGCAIQSLAHNW